MSAFLNITLNLLLIPVYGAVGAAIATAISVSSVNFLRVLQIYSLFKIHPFNGKYLLPILASFILFLVFSVARTEFPVVFWGQNLLFGLAVSALVAMLLIFYSFSKDDRLILHKIRVKISDYLMST